VQRPPASRSAGKGFGPREPKKKVGPAARQPLESSAKARDRSGKATHSRLSKRGTHRKRQQRQLQRLRSQQPVPFPPRKTEKVANPADDPSKKGKQLGASWMASYAAETLSHSAADDGR